MLPTVTAYNCDGTIAQLLETDAKAACRDHPKEWSLEPWSTAQVKEARSRIEQRKQDQQPASGKTAIDLHMAKLSGATLYNGKPIE